MLKAKFEFTITISMEKIHRTLILDTLNKVSEEVCIKGWVDSIRDHGKIVFIDLRDRSGLIQCVGEGIEKVSPESAVEITGMVKKRPEKLVNSRIPTGLVEIEIAKLKVLSPAEELPFDMGKDDLNLDLPTLLDYRALTLRNKKQQSIFKVESAVVGAFREALIKKDFIEFQAPSIILSVPEGGAEVFEIDYFGKKAYLSQSPQLYKSLLVGSFERVFSVNQIFRAEPSVTTRHIAEATSLDVEFGFIDSWEEVLDMQEYVIRYIFDKIQSDCADELALFGATIPLLSDKTPSVKFKEAQAIISKRLNKDITKEKDLSPEGEREICKWAKEEYKSDLIYITHFLTKKKPFYVHPDPEDPEYALSVDLLARGVEWSSGGQRLNDYKTILANVDEWGLKEKDIALYLQSFRYGVPPLGGFALGLERIVMQILGLANVREATLFPRDMERIDIRLSSNNK